MDDKTPGSRIHWTAKASCGLSVCLAILFLVRIFLPVLSTINSSLFRVTQTEYLRYYL